jgi:sulfur-oxidizing protein SoxZ
MAEPMRIRAQVQGDRTTVRILMSHEMESGQRKDAAGRAIPAWFIQEVVVQHAGRTVLAAQWGAAVSKNPYLQFSFKGGKPGDRISVSWTDSRGDKRSDEAPIT